MQDYTEILQECIDTLELSLKRQLLEDGRKATGKTIDEIYNTVTPDTGTLLGPARLYYLIHGRGPTSEGAPTGEPTLKDAITAWLRAKGEDIKRAGFIAQRIHKFGTLLYQGKDPRWPGQREATTLTDVINEQTLGTFRAKLGTAARQNLVSELVDLNKFQ
jgi:hypothetical protein